jgi:hypothetical protein
MTWTSSGVTEVTIKGVWTNNKPIINVLHVTRGADVNSTVAARDVLNNWQDHIVNGILANNYTLQGATFRDRGAVAGETGFIAPDPAKTTVGTNTSITTPPSVALLVRKAIATTAGNRSGRMYLGATQENEIDEDGRLSAALISAVNTKLALFFNGVDDTDQARLVVVHGTGDDFGEKEKSNVTSLLIDPMVATQRRRLR